MEDEQVGSSEGLLGGCVRMRGRSNAFSCREPTPASGM